MQQISMFSLEEPPANPSPSPASGPDWMTRVATSCSPLLQLLADIGPGGWYGRTSPVSFQAMEDETLRAFWECSQGEQSSPQAADSRIAESYRASKELTASHGECLTLSMCEWTATPGPSHSDAGVCLLSDILETGTLPQRYYLSPKACQGILRRAEKRGKELPAPLAHALKAAADLAQTST